MTYFHLETKLKVKIIFNNKDFMSTIPSLEWNIEVNKFIR